MENDNQKLCLKRRRRHKSDLSEKRPKRMRLRFRTWDRLSALPDAIICDILSRLPMKSAVKTSVLSRRWRHLWTGVSHIDYNVVVINRKRKAGLKRYNNFCSSVIQQLTCQKLQSFHLDVSALLEPVLVDSIFLHVYNRNVEEFVFNGMYAFSSLPAFLLHSPSLVTLKLYGFFQINLPENATVCLPNLKHLVLSYLLNLPTWLEPLFASSPLLESFVLHAHDPSKDFPESITLLAPALTSLEIYINTDEMILNHTNFFIDAPKLCNLDIIDNANFYYFVRDHCPATLLNARLNLRRAKREFFNFRPIVIGEGYLHRMSMFVRGMYAVRNLELQVDASSDIFPTLYSANITDGVCPMFRNITSFTTTWGEDIGLNGWTHLLPLLHFFPNLNHLNVKMGNSVLEKAMEWDFCPADSVPRCLVSHLKTINIAVTFRAEFNLNSIAAYILSHALVLEELRFTVSFFYDPKEPLQLKQHLLCRSLFNLPKCSKCEVVFSGPSITASSSTYEYGIAEEVHNGPTSAL